jgi:hypothetical protein
MLYVPLLVLADNTLDAEYIQNIKKEYGVILDKLFAQAQEKLLAQEDIVAWLYHKNTQEFRDVQNLMTDFKVEVCFNCSDENAVKKELEGYVKEKIQNEAQKVLDADGITAENMQDFFHISRMICSVTLESDDTCHKMMRALKKEYRFAMEELRALDKAREKIKEIDRERTKQELLHKLREQIILGTSPRK